MCATHVPGSLRREELVARYAGAHRARYPEYRVLLLLRALQIGGVAQQIYWRYQQGLTHDERFAAMIHAVRALSATARRAIESGHI